MSLTELISFMNTTEGFISLGVLIVLFIWMYARAAIELRRTDTERLERLHRSLLLYTSAVGPLTEATERLESSEQGLDAEEHAKLVILLQECKAAPTLTRDLLEHIDAFLREPDHTRSWLLHKKLNREINQCIKEQSEILKRVEHPSLGRSFWNLIKPVIPFAATLASLWWTIQLVASLTALPLDPDRSLAWQYTEIWTRWISCLAATAALYLVAMNTKRHTLRIAPLAAGILIVLAAFFHLLGPAAAPYVLAVQLLCCVAGFSSGTAKSRKQRPYPGMEQPAENSDSLTAAGLATEDKRSRSDRS